VSDLDRVSKLLQEAMDQFDDPTLSVAANLRRCQRIASLRGDAANLSWLILEGRDLQAERAGPHDRLVDRLMRDLPEEDRTQVVMNHVSGYFNRRKVSEDKEKIYGHSVEQIETLVRTMRDQAGAMVTPEGMHPVDLALRLQDMDKARGTLTENRLPLENVLARVRAALWDFLVETEWQLTFGEASAETFDRLRRYVDRQLTVLSPPALEQFQSAYRRLREASPEARAHAVTSSRRVLKTLADLLYPAREGKVAGLDGKPRDMKDDNVINRLAQYVTETVGKHENGEVVQAAVDNIGQRVNALIGLSGKGVHAEIADYEVDTCVVQTYLVVADLLRIRERAAHAAVEPPD
jgi:ribosomal protein S17E